MTSLRLLLLSLTLLLPVTVAAQEEDASEDDGGFITRTIENALSGAGREVNLVGFQGALSAEASFDRLTIADAEGIWLTLEDAKLLWSRAALLRGRLQVEELSARRLDLPRLPQSEEAPALPDAEAEPFSMPQLPDLPVSINIERLAVGEIALGEPLLGVPAVLQLDAVARLDDDGLDVDLLAERIDGMAGRFVIDLSFAREGGVMDLDFGLDEAPGGLAARALNLPGQPSVTLSVAGAGPLDNLNTDISLATDGAPRLTGQVALRAVPAPEGETPGRQVLADLGGDISALVAPAYRDFFGQDMGLRLDATQEGTGAIDVSDLRLATRGAQLAGRMRLNEEYWPEFIDLDAAIARADGQPVVPPGAGEGTDLQGATLRVLFDAAAGDALDARLGVDRLRTTAVEIGTTFLTLNGTLSGAPGTAGRFAGDLAFETSDLSFADDALGSAIGAAIEGRARIDYAEGEPLRIDDLALAGADYGLTGAFVIEELARGFPTDLALAVAANDLARFSGLAGQPLSGRADLTVDGSVTPLSGMFDLAIAGKTEDVSAGIEAADNLMRGETTLDLVVRRDTGGTAVEGLALRNAALDLTADVTLQTAGSTVTANGRLADLALVVPDHPGPVTFAVEAAQARGGWQVDADLSAPYDAQLAVEGLATGPNADVQIALAVPDLAPIVPELSGPLSLDGRLWQAENGYSVDVTGSGPLSARFEAKGLATGPQTALDVVLSVPELAPLVPDIPGGIDLSGRLTQAETGYHVDAEGLGPYSVAFAVAGVATGPDAALDLDLRLPDVQPLVPQLEGPLTVEGRVNATPDAQYAVDLTARGPLEAVAEVSGVATGPDAAIALDLAIPEISGLVPNLTGPLKVAGDITQAGSGFAIDIEGGGPLEAAFTAKGLATGPETDLQFTLAAPSLQPLAPPVTGPVDLGGRVWLTEAGYNVDVAGQGPLSAEYTVAGLATGPEAALTLGAVLPEVAALVPGLNGALNVDASVDRQAAGWQIDSQIAGPSGSVASVAGQALDDGTLDMTATGSAPLGLANSFIAPRSVVGGLNFDLALQGAAGLEALSGRVSTSGARFVDPTQRLVINNLETTVDIADAVVRLALGGAVEAGGRIEAGGTLGLAGALPADLAVGLRDLVLTDPRLYTTTLNGDIAINGPLTGEARIAGRIDVGETSVSVPASSVTSVGAIPLIRHVGGGAAARQTRARAGLEEEPEPQSSSGGSGGLALDIEIDAPGKIFIRGRGLDAELGGNIELGGTTAQIISIGEFELIRGRIDILGKRFDLVEGNAQFVGSTTPLIRFVTTASTNDGTASITVEGPADEPEVTFSSSPEAPEDEVIAQLLFNRSVSELTAFQALQLANAVAVLAGRSGLGVVGSLREGIGLDDFDVTTTDDGGTALRAGKYISENVYTDFTAAGDGESELSINLDVTDSLKARGVVGEDGDTGIGFLFERDY